MKRKISTIPVFENTTPMESWYMIVLCDDEPIHLPVIGWANIETITNSQGDSVSFLVDDEGKPVLAPPETCQDT